MTIRPTTTRRLGLAVTAVLLAPLGADTVAYAATGHSIVAGKLNRSDTTTVVRNTGKGPALVLKSKGRSPSLGVSSERLVKRLNADRLDGRHAEDLAPVTHLLTIMRPGESLATPHFFRVRLPAGDYLITLNGLFRGQATKYCALVDPLRLRDEREFILGAETRDLSVGGTTAATLGGQELLVGCGASDFDTEPVAMSPVTVAFRALAGVQPLSADPVADPFDESQARAGRGLDGR